MEHITYKVGYSFDPVTGERGPLDETNPMFKLVQKRVSKALQEAKESLDYSAAETHNHCRDHIDDVVKDWCRS